MTITVPGVPANVRVPFLYFGIDNSQAGYFSASSRILLIGQMLSSGSAQPEQPVIVFGNEDALFGRGSMLARMCKAARRKTSFAEVWALPLTDSAAGIKSEFTLNFTVTASELVTPGYATVYIAGSRYAVPVYPGDSPGAIAASMADAINGDVDRHVDATASGADVTLTARHAGELAGQIDVRERYRGAGGQVAGVSLAIAQTVTGGGNPDIAAALSVLGDEPYKWLAQPYLDADNVAATREFFSDTNGRWSAMRMVYGHAFAARTDATPAQLIAFGETLNDQHLSILGIYRTPTPAYIVSADLAAFAYAHLSDPPELSRPEQTIELPSVLAPEMVDRFNKDVRQALYFSGIGSYTVTQEGAVRLDRLLTTYQVNGHGAEDTSYLDVNTMAQLMYFIESMNNFITRTFPRVALKNDGEPIFPGQFAVTPKLVRSYVVAEAERQNRLGVIEDIEGFVERLVIQRSELDPNCLEMVLAPDFINQWRVGKILVQFFNQYPATV